MNKTILIFLVAFMGQVHAKCIDPVTKLQVEGYPHPESGLCLNTTYSQPLQILKSRQNDEFIFKNFSHKKSKYITKFNFSDIKSFQLIIMEMGGRRVSHPMIKVNFKSRNVELFENYNDYLNDNVCEKVSNIIFSIEPIGLANEKVSFLNFFTGEMINYYRISSLQDKTQYAKKKSYKLVELDLIDSFNFYDFLYTYFEASNKYSLQTPYYLLSNNCVTHLSEIFKTVATLDLNTCKDLGDLNTSRPQKFYKMLLDYQIMKDKQRKRVD